MKDMKFDDGKALMAAIPPKALLEVGKVLEFGARKYERDSWRDVPDAKTRYTDALARHLYQSLSGELTDGESGLSHLAHLACNALFILELELNED